MEPSSLVLRVGGTDIDDLCPIVEGWRYKPYHYFPSIEEKDIYRYCLAEIGDAVSRDDGIFIRAYKNSKCVGFLCFTHLSWDSAIYNLKMGRIDFLFSEGDYLTQLEVNRALLTHLFNMTRNRGYYHISAKSDSRDLAGIHAFIGKGYLLMDTMMKYVYNMRFEVSTPECDLLIRSFEEKDLAEVLELTYLIFNDHFDRFHLDPSLSKEKSTELHIKWVENSCRGYADVVLLAEINERIIGFHTCRFSKKLQDIIGLRVGVNDLGGVHPNCRSKGIITSINREAIKILKGKLDYVEAPVHVHNLPVQRALSKVGYRMANSYHDFHMAI